MKVLSLTNGTQYTLNDEQYTALKAVLDKGSTRFVVIEGDLIMVNAIIAIQDEEKGEEAIHRRNGDYQCSHGFWHSRGERCFGHDGWEQRGVKENGLKRLPIDRSSIDPMDMLTA